MVVADPAVFMFNKLFARTFQSELALCTGVIGILTGHVVVPQHCLAIIVFHIEWNILCQASFLSYFLFLSHVGEFEHFSTTPFDFDKLHLPGSPCFKPKYGVNKKLRTNPKVKVTQYSFEELMRKLSSRFAHDSCFRNFPQAIFRSLELLTNEMFLPQL